MEFTGILIILNFDIRGWGNQTTGDREAPVTFSPS